MPATNDTIVINSGTINLTAPVTIAGVFNWSGGTLTGEFCFSSPRLVFLNLSGGGTKVFANVLTNAGLVVWTGGTMYAQKLRATRDILGRWRTWLEAF